MRADVAPVGWLAAPGQQKSQASQRTEPACVCSALTPRVRTAPALQGALTPGELAVQGTPRAEGAPRGRGGSPGALSRAVQSSAPGLRSSAQPGDAERGGRRGRVPAPRPGPAPTAAARVRGSRARGSLLRAYPEPHTGFAEEMCVSVRLGTRFQKGCVWTRMSGMRLLCSLPPFPRSCRTEAEPSKGPLVQPPRPPPP